MSRLQRPVAIAGAGAVSAFGVGWRGLAAAVRGGAIGPAVSLELEVSHPGTLASEVPPLPPALDAGDAKARKLMSRAARLAAIALREALREASWEGSRAEVGAWFGVGASGGPMSELDGMLRGGLDGDRFSLTRLGREGLQASNPLLTFQLLNNFTLCHGAILEGTGGPNGAFYSRGSGTAAALAEAAHALLGGDCARAIAAGADTALHPVTWSELVREGWAGRGLVPGEGAAALALDAHPTAAPLGWLDAVQVAPGSSSSLAESAAAALDAVEPREVGCVVIAPWGSPARAALLAAVAARLPDATILDLSASFGDALAATPALAWATALDALVSGLATSAVALTAGIDGAACAACLRAA